MPQLVLVGRDDTKLDKYVPARSAIESGHILILQGVTDKDLETLYRSCQFTAFPSLSEGYGLPVAESLTYGKLCVASDLQVIKEHAHDFPWYFVSGDEESAYQVFRRAIVDISARRSAESKIVEAYQPCFWVDTYDFMASKISGAGSGLILDALDQPDMPSIPGFKRPPVLSTLTTVQHWCTEESPDVSILIVNWHAVPLTRACIQHIWANTTDVRYEIIIADNGSSEEDLRALASFGSGVRLLSLGTNRFFGEACNIAAEHARGRLLCLLNNDCFGQMGWLARLVEGLGSDPSVGAAGPLFLFPDQTVQEAGGAINENGFPIRFGRGDRLERGANPEYLMARSVDYISAAALVIHRETYWRAGGFDLAYEPAYYEDADLCFKLRALGRSVKFCPDARAIHVEGASANDDPVAEARRKALGDLNRGKFVSRWGRYLQGRSEADLAASAKEIFIDVSTPPNDTGRSRAALYTPYALTPGGGERFLLTIASFLIRKYDVTIVTPHPYSQLRLLNLGFELDIDLSTCRSQTEEAFLAGPAPDLMITVGNQIIPPIQARTSNSFFICQFPFPIGHAAIPNVSEWQHGYRRVIAYSEYAKAHIISALRAYQMPAWPVEVAYPPVPPFLGTATAKKPIILTIGRFFTGGHNKRHDLMIEAFRRLYATIDGNIEMHLVGSSIPDPVHMKYLEDLMRMADGIPIKFHVNASQKTLMDLCRDASVYWHSTGLGADLIGDPSKAEHFGISLVEAMAAECVPLAFNAGGPREIVTNGVNGYLYNSIDELIGLTHEILKPERNAERLALGQAAGRRARDFAPEVFHKRIWQVLQQDSTAATVAMMAGLE